MTSLHPRTGRPVLPTTVVEISSCDATTYLYQEFGTVELEVIEKLAKLTREQDSGCKPTLSVRRFDPEPYGRDMEWFEDNGYDHYEHRWTTAS